jgi:hypothetical protein
VTGVSATLGTAHDVEVDAPDGAAALELEHRLFTLRPTAIFRRGHWVVDLPGVHSVDSVEGDVKEWLRLTGTAAATIRVDGRSHTVVAKPRSGHRPSHGDFIG